MPVMYLGHGSPMNAIEDNAYRRSWQAIGAQFGKDYPTPQLVLCVSAHWMTRGWWLTGQAQPKTIHDFGGFPADLFAQQYPAAGAPAVAETLSSEIIPIQGTVGVDAHEWGYDHGTWGVLKPMFPLANIPVLQLSLDMTHPMNEHLAMGQQLRTLRDKGVLIVGSGNAVHNLRAFAMNRAAGQHQTYDWGTAFDAWVQAKVADQDYAALAAADTLGNTFKMAHPSIEHYLPLLHAAGAADVSDTLHVFNADAVQGDVGGAISMRSFVWR